MDPHAANVPPFCNTVIDSRENASPNSAYSFEGRIIGKKRPRILHNGDDIQQIPNSSPTQQGSRNNNPSPVVIDLTDDTGTIEISDSPITLSVGQDYNSFEQDQKLAQELQMQEFSTANARVSHSQTILHRRISPPQIPLTFRYHHHRHHDAIPTRRVEWGSFQTDNTRRYRPPWSSSNDQYLNLNLLQRDFNGDDYELLSSLDTTVKKKAASRKEISSLPIKKLKVSDIEKDECCSICLQDFEKGDRVRTLPCDHYFHVKCIGQWLRVNKTCPVDRKEITPAEIWKSF